jgi:hypothetical protein
MKARAHNEKSKRMRVLGKEGVRGPGLPAAIRQV